MSASEAAPARKPRSFLRSWPPRIVLALGVLSLLWIWLTPAEDFDRGQRFMATAATAILVWLLLAIWLVGFSGYSWWGRLALIFVPVAVVIGASRLTIREVHFAGDMVPLFHFRWEPSQADHDALLEANRSQAGAERPGEAVLDAERPTDFPEYRGRQRGGIVLGPPLARDWKARPPRLLWRQPSGGGYAGFAVAGNAAVTLEQRRDKEAVVCYDAATGHERWVHAYPALFQETMGGNGPRATPTIAGGDVYALGATGMLHCLEGSSGRLKWVVNILQDNDNLPWGMSGSPLVYDQVVVVNPGAQRSSAAGHALVAYDRASGRPVWSAGSAKAAYSSPMLATLAGRRQVLVFDAAGLGGYDAATGQELWRYPWETYQDINVAQPVVLPGDRVFISSGYGHGCALLQITTTDGHLAAKPVWPKTPNPAMHCKFSSPVAYQGYLYGLDEGILVCLDAATGERKWKEGRYGHGQVLLAGELLLILAESGKLVLVEATPQGHHELGSIPALHGEKTWNYPALAGRRAFVRNHVEMACYELPVAD